MLFAYAYPGYMNFDSGEQIFQVRTGQFSDWHPPLMTAYWWLIEIFIAGPLGMFVLQSVLFLWGLFHVLRTWLGEKAAAWAASLLLLFPPVFTPMAVVWKDAQMAAFLVAGLALVLRPSRCARLLGLFLWFLAAGVRDNGVVALPFLVFWAAGTWGFQRGRRIVVTAGLTIAIALLATSANRALTRRHDHPWYRSLALMDITGTIRYADSISDEELRRTLAGTGFRGDADIQRIARDSYSSRAWFDIKHGGEPLFDEPLDAASRRAVSHAWWSLVTDHPRAYLRHRVAVMQGLMGLTDQPTWEPVAQSLAGNEHQLARIGHAHRHSPLQRRVGSAYRDHLGDGPLYRPWLYSVLAIILLVDAALQKGRELAALLAAALLYQLSFLIGAAAPDFRYSHWMVTCTCVAIVVATASRLRGTQAG